MQGLSPRDKPSEPRWDWPWGWQHLRLSPSIPHPGRGQGDPQGKHVNGRLGDLALQPPPLRILASLDLSGAQFRHHKMEAVPVCLLVRIWGKT